MFIVASQIFCVQPSIRAAKGNKPLLLLLVVILLLFETNVLNQCFKPKLNSGVEIRFKNFLKLSSV